MPSVSAVRPASCAACGAASRPVGAPLGLHGHGRRSRQVRGPLDAGASPVLVELRVRRYRCRACGVSQTVVPAEVLGRKLYSLAAIAWALALWGLESLSAAAVRRRVSPWDVVGPGSAGRWDALCRWAGEARRGTLLCCVRPAPADWTARAVAARAATTVAAFALPAMGPPSLSACSFRGAERAR
ncbi:transposase family protein [Myxococcus xanthus]|uniref:transposase family protein n=1 Tax=Myxococcus xanthus TaxID=34 RepID=UPI00112C43CC|nr:transposase family protein [Myxococcus xanthus]